MLESVFENETILSFFCFYNDRKEYKLYNDIKKNHVQIGIDNQWYGRNCRPKKKKHFVGL